MPASLYRLANKPHYTESHESASSVIVESPTHLATVEEPVSAVSEAPAVEPTVTEVPPDVLDTEKKSVSISWDPMWTKTQLLEVAAQLGLEVTSVNTKVQIIEALTAATSS